MGDQVVVVGKRKVVVDDVANRKTMRQIGCLFRTISEDEADDDEADDDEADDDEADEDKADDDEADDNSLDTVSMECLEGDDEADDGRGLTWSERFDRLRSLEEGLVVLEKQINDHNLKYDKRDEDEADDDEDEDEDDEDEDDEDDEDEDDEDEDDEDEDDEAEDEDDDEAEDEADMLSLQDEASADMISLQNEASRVMGNGPFFLLTQEMLTRNQARRFFGALKE
jgi:hypothetical protein